MRAIYNGIVYDTDSDNAKRVATWSNGYYRSDFKWCEEDLYRTKKGRWFLHGYGGGLSKYRETTGNGWCSGEVIQPMTDDEAKAWLEDSQCVDAYNKYFGDDLEEA